MYNLVALNTCVALFLKVVFHSEETACTAVKGLGAGIRSAFGFHFSLLLDYDLGQFNNLSNLPVSSSVKW